MRRVILSLLLMSLGSCSILGARPVAHDHAAGTTAGGVLWRDLASGMGSSAKTGDRLTVDYEICLQDGTQVDSTLDRGSPESFVLGQAPIAGWNEALLGMRVGGRRRLEVPPELAFGNQGLPGRVPPNAHLVCEVEVTAIEAAPAAASE